MLSQLLGIPIEFNSPSLKSDRVQDASLKVLGLRWVSNEDSLGLELRPLLSALNSIKCTKRNVLQIAAKIFDPSGYIAHFIIKIQFILQELWLKGLDWDEEFSGELKENWKGWISEIEVFTKLSIPRHYFGDLVYVDKENVQIHIFTDASPLGFGGVAYYRYKVAQDEFKASFIMSKLRVAPLKKLTLPRLELMGALIGSRLANYLKSILPTQGNIFFML